MRATIFNSGFKEERWTRMMAISFLFHLMIFSTVLFIPKTPLRFPSIEERVYHVELIGAPSGLRSGVKGEDSLVKKKNTSHILHAETRRIGIGREKPAPILAKRVSPKPKDTYRDETSPASGLIDRAISKIERKVKEDSIAKKKNVTRILHAETRRIGIRREKPAPILAKRVSPKPKETYRDETTPASGLIDRAISKIERKVKEEEAAQGEKILDKPEGKSEGNSNDLLKGRKGGMPGVFSGIGKIIQIYQMEIESAIKNNWSYPVTLLDLKKDKAPEAVVIVIVQSDGKILKAWFKKRSNNRLFDDSVLKAIEKSDPLPKFPPGYRKSYDEVEINFSLKDLV